MSDKISNVLAIIYVVVAIILIIVVLILIDRHNKKKYHAILDELERNKNLILSGSILTELNKVSSLINNKDLEHRYQKWQERYKKIKDEDIPVIDDKLNDLEDLFKTRKFKKINEAIAKVELQIYYVKAKSEFLLGEIKEISLSESKNREIVTKLKKDYRSVYLKYNDHPLDYETIKVPIELQFENVDKLFASFETVMEESPSIILMGKTLIPNKIKEIEEIADKMTRDAYNIEYLNIDYNISESNKKIADIFDRLKVLNLTDSIFELKTILSYFESLYQDFDNEKVSKKAYEENSRKIAIKCKRLLAIIGNLSSKIEDIKYSYDLTDDEVKIIDELNLNIKGIQNDYEIIVENYRNKTFAYSKGSEELEHLNMKLSTNEDKLELTLKNLSSLKEDEVRAREQLEDIRKLLKESKEIINTYKLPLIPKTYYTELSEANDALEVMINELDKKPISIKVLNLRVDTARDLVLKLYKTTNDTIKNAKMAENTIVYGNRFRINNNVNQGLDKAEDSFFKGEYKESLEYAINAIAIIDPNIHKKIFLTVKNN